MSATLQRRFMLSQVKAIRRYVQQYPNENPNLVIMRWVELYAEDYRRTWEENHIGA